MTYALRWYRNRKPCHAKMPKSGSQNSTKLDQTFKCEDATLELLELLMPSEATHYNRHLLKRHVLSQEDAHATVLDVSDSGKASGVGLFGVFDGHGGKAVAKFVAKHMVCYRFQSAFSGFALCFKIEARVCMLSCSF